MHELRLGALTRVSYTPGRCCRCYRASARQRITRASCHKIVSALLGSRRGERTESGGTGGGGRGQARPALSGCGARAAALPPAGRSGSALPEADEEAAQRVPPLGAVGLRRVLGGLRAGGRRGRAGVGQQAQLRLGRGTAGAAGAGAERRSRGAGVPPPPPQPGQDLPPVVAAAGAEGRAAPRLPAVGAAPRRPAARRPAAQPQLAGPRRRAQLPAAPVPLRRGEPPRPRLLRRIPLRAAGGGPQGGQGQQRQGRPHPRRASATERPGAGRSLPPHLPRPADTRSVAGGAPAGAQPSGSRQPEPGVERADPTRLVTPGTFSSRPSIRQLRPGTTPARKP